MILRTVLAIMIPFSLFASTDCDEAVLKHSEGFYRYNEMMPLPVDQRSTNPEMKNQKGFSNTGKGSTSDFASWVVFDNATAVGLDKISLLSFFKKEESLCTRLEFTYGKSGCEVSKISKGSGSQNKGELCSFSDMEKVTVIKGPSASRGYASSGEKETSSAIESVVPLKKKTQAEADEYFLNFASCPDGYKQGSMRCVSIE